MLRSAGVNSRLPSEGEEYEEDGAPPGYPIAGPSVLPTSENEGGLYDAGQDKLNEVEDDVVGEVKVVATTTARSHSSCSDQIS